MSGLFTDVWKIVKPVVPKQGYISASPDDFRLYSNFSWYNKVMKGAGSRFAKYNQYNNMDSDVFVARALDTIAEEMATKDDKTGLPFDIVYQNEVNTEIPETIITTIRAALRHWSEKQSLASRSFDISRLLIKFGDCFFRKTSDFKRWEYIEPDNVIGVSINAETGEIDYYQLRKGAVAGSTRVNQSDLELVPAKGIIHFSLSSGLGAAGPFGSSVLEPTLKAYRHLTLLEDSVIIYRITRAPERRVFNIDVGNMPPQRAKAYLESIKNDLRQKRIPNDSGGQERIDSNLNPMSMTEDFFFASTSDGRGNKVDTLPGGENLGEIGDLNYFQNKFLQGLRIPASYMRGSTDSGSQIADGKVGVAYIEELRFGSYVKRLQQNLSPTYDREFKAYLKSAGINIDPNIFKIVLIDPQNFDIYRRAEVDEKLIANYTGLKDDKTISTRMKQRFYLAWNEDDIQANEMQLKQETGIPEGGIEGISELRFMYDPAVYEKREVKFPELFDDFAAPKEAQPEAEPESTKADESSETSTDLADQPGVDDSALDQVDLSANDDVKPS